MVNSVFSFYFKKEVIIYYCVFGFNEMDLCSKVKFLQSLNH